MLWQTGLQFCSGKAYGPPVAQGFMRYHQAAVLCQKAFVDLAASDSVTGGKRHNVTDTEGLQCTARGI